jgi:hypothetical protein
MPAPTRAAAWAVVLAVGCGLTVTAASAACATEHDPSTLAPARLPRVATPAYYPAMTNYPATTGYSAATQYPMAPALAAPPTIEDLPPPSYEPAPFDSVDAIDTQPFPPTVPPRWFASAEFLMARPIMSDAVAFLSGVRDPNTNQVIGTVTSFGYNYEPSGRAGFG